jgi:hypothetical protein
LYIQVEMLPLTLLGFLASLLAAGGVAILVYRKKDAAAALLVGTLTLLVCNGLFFGLLAILSSFSNM